MLFIFLNFLIVMRRPVCVCVCISALNELLAPVSVVAVAFLAVSGIEVSERWMIGLWCKRVVGGGCGMRSCLSCMFLMGKQLFAV